MGGERDRPRTGRRLLWTLAAVLMLVHSIAAFGTFYGWSHDDRRGGDGAPDARGHRRRLQAAASTSTTRFSLLWLAMPSGGG